MRITANRNRSKIIAVAAIGLLAVMTLPIDAMAQDAVTKALDKGVDLLTNRWARAAAIIALAVLGYGMWSGWWNKRMALGWVGGVALVFGGATIVDFFTA
jgi:type IV secretion system protein VirB2